MKRILGSLIFLALALTAHPLLAQEQGLYFNIGMGWADPAYEEELEFVFSELEDLPGMERTAIAVDLGLYWPVGRSGMLGPALSGMGDRFEQHGVDMQLNHYLLGLSFRQYAGGERGKGFFFRGDAGMARVVIQASGEDDYVSDMGFGVLFGGGYSFRIGGGTWFSLNADYAYKTVESDKVGGLSIGGAFLF